MLSLYHYIKRIIISMQTNFVFQYLLIKLGPFIHCGSPVTSDGHKTSFS